MGVRERTGEVESPTTVGKKKEWKEEVEPPATVVNRAARGSVPFGFFISATRLWAWAGRLDGLLQMGELEFEP